jgi:hypothetical protein
VVTPTHDGAAALGADRDRGSRLPRRQLGRQQRLDRLGHCAHQPIMVRGLDKFVWAADRGCAHAPSWPTTRSYLSWNYRRTPTWTSPCAFADVVIASRAPVLAARAGSLRGELKARRRPRSERTVSFTAPVGRSAALVASATALSAAWVDPASLLEAMASGLPAVCGIAPSIDEWVGQGDGAELVPCRDEAAVAAALLGLLRDPDRRRAHGGLARGKERIGDPGLALEQYRSWWRRESSLGIDGADCDLASAR